jgi:hypothetical protein
MNGARTISRRAAGGQDTGSAARRLQTIKEMLALLERQRQGVLGRFERRYLLTTRSTARA